MPPAAQVTNQETYVSCFCQSALITQLHSTGNGVCDAECTNPSDRSLLQTWYNNYCQSGGNAPTSTTTTAADPPSTTTSSVRTTPQWDAPQPWYVPFFAAFLDWDLVFVLLIPSFLVDLYRIKTHYRWVIMIVVLFVGFTIIGVGAMWLKRRHDAKNPGLYHGANRGGSSGTLFNNHHDSGATPGPPGSVPGPPGMCGPQQAMVHPLSSPSHYTNPESMASSSRTAVATPNLPDITEPRTPTPNTARSSSRFQKKPAGYGDVEIREV